MKQSEAAMTNSRPPLPTIDKSPPTTLLTTSRVRAAPARSQIWIVAVRPQRFPDGHRQKAGGIISQKVRASIAPLHRGVAPDCD